MLKLGELVLLSVSTSSLYRQYTMFVCHQEVSEESSVEARLDKVRKKVTNYCLTRTLFSKLQVANGMKATENAMKIVFAGQ